MVKVEKRNYANDAVFYWSKDSSHSYFWNTYIAEHKDSIVALVFWKI